MKIQKCHICGANGDIVVRCVVYCDSCRKELILINRKERDRLAKIGEAIEKAISNGYYIGNPINDGQITQNDIDELIKWSEGEE